MANRIKISGTTNASFDVGLQGTGNLTAGNANLGNAATANYFIGSGNNLSNIQAANISGTVATATTAGTVTTASQPNITSHGTLTDLASGGTVNFTTASNVSLGPIANVHISGGTSGYVLSTDGTGTLNWVAQSGGGGSGTPGGNTTELQFNNAGSFGGIPTVTYSLGNLSLGSIANLKITGGSNNYVMSTDGVGNLNFTTKSDNLTIGTRSTSVNIPISNYTMNVEGRTGNITVNVN